jgi:creatinine amidohydrolase
VNSISVVEHRLAYLTRRELLARAAAGAICAVPVGSLEQHGDHLPVGTDTLLVEAVCVQAAAQSEADVIVAPGIWTGYSPHHVRFGATVSLTANTFLALIQETVSSIRQWLPPVVLVNGHGGNRGILQTVALAFDLPQLNYWDVECEAAKEFFPADHGSIGHAGQAETSMMLALAQGCVGVPSSDFLPCHPDDPLLRPSLGESGVIGDPRRATAETGAAYMDSVVRALAVWFTSVCASTLAD